MFRVCTSNWSGVILNVITCQSGRLPYRAVPSFPKRLAIKQKPQLKIQHKAIKRDSRLLNTAAVSHKIPTYFVRKCSKATAWSLWVIRLKRFYFGDYLTVLVWRLKFYKKVLETCQDTSFEEERSEKPWDGYGMPGLLITEERKTDYVKNRRSYFLLLINVDSQCLLH